ncbi:MAG: hypothetical protein FGM40_04355 [Rhodocyclaceae bacterium]|nr:hypothetical protein [Rhodocyclaceae bacterium]
MSQGLRTRLAFLLETVALESEHLLATDGRLFAEPFTAERAATLTTDDALAERLDAFTARFGRLQDTAGDKLLPTLLQLLGEPLGSALDNLERAARLGLLSGDSEDWMAARALRNRMVHDYIRNPALLSEAVSAAHAAVPMLVHFAASCREYAVARRLTSR